VQWPELGRARALAPRKAPASSQAWTQLRLCPVLNSFTYCYAVDLPRVCTARGSRASGHKKGGAAVLFCSGFALSEQGITVSGSAVTAPHTQDRGAASGQGLCAVVARMTACLSCLN
jgi:hypothetical protein